MRKSNRWVRGAGALIAAGWAMAFMPVPSALAGTLPSNDAPPVNSSGWVEVSNYLQLEYIDENQSSYLNSNIELMDNIDMGGYAWTPLFGNVTTSYSGTFNGNAHTISGWSVNTSASAYGGFFGRTSGTIENLGVQGNVKATSNSMAGGLVGAQYGGTIDNSYATGSVSGTYAGGLVGDQYGGTIQNSYATGSVNGDLAGGLVGLQDSGSITNSYFDTSSAKTNDGIGGSTSTIGASSLTIGAETHAWMQTSRNFTSAGWSTSTWAFYNGQYPLLSGQVPLTISSSASPTTVGGGGTVTVTGSVYSSGGSPLSGVNVTLSDGSAGGSWGNSSVTTDTSGNFTGTWTAPNTTTTATVTASVYGTSVQQQSTIQVQAFTVTYNGNGNTSGTVPTDSSTYTSGSNATVLGNTGSLIKTGYTFAGWTTTKAGSGTVYTLGASLTMPASNVTLYAKWTAAPPHTVTFNSKGGSAVASETVAYNGTATKPTDPTKAGYTFAGWYSDSGLTAQYNFTTLVTGNETLYAKWTAIVHSGPIPPSIITSFFPESPQVGEAYSAQVREIGGVEPMKWTITNGSLPPGLTLSNQGVISGTPTSAGNYTFTVKVTDANSLSFSKKLTLVVNGASTLFIKTTTVVPTNQPGQFFKQTLTADGGNPPYTWSIVEGKLPSGLKLNPSTGVVSGITTQKSPEILTVEVQDATGMTQEKQVVIDSLPKNEREIVWETPGLAAQNVPAVTGSDSGTQTTYMPIWYAMQLLKPLGITSTWDGTNWHMTTSTQPNLSSLVVGHGTTSIYLNGTVVQSVNTVAATDPSTGKATTYMPIWYVMQLLNRVGLHSTWNGITWIVTK